MSFVKSFFKNEQNYTDKKNQLTFTNIFNKEEDFKVTNQYLTNKQLKIQTIIHSIIIDYDQLKNYAWNGIPHKYRSQSWKILLKYMPTNKKTQLETLTRKRKDYLKLVNNYIQHPTIEKDQYEKKNYKLICDDVIRTLPDSPLFRNQIVQDLLKRILYVWHMRHPASGYVQGINDIATPFIMLLFRPPNKFPAFKNNNCSISKQILIGVYVNQWMEYLIIIHRHGLEQKSLFKKSKRSFSDWIEQNIDFYHLYFKWINCLLLRQFSPKVGLRLFDTYISQEQNCGNLCLYVMAAILLKFSKKIRKLHFQEFMLFSQNMPTKLWTQAQLSLVISEAYVYQQHFI